MVEHARIRKLLLVGWDGAEPSIVSGMLKQGRLPRLASLIERGFFTTVSSTVPPSSLPAWTSAVTGVSPGRHGLVDFVTLDRSRRRLRLVSAADLAEQTLFEAAGRAGLSTACLGMPGSWPIRPPAPHAAAGVCIAGFDSPVATRAAKIAFWPTGLYDELKARGLDWPYGLADELSVSAGWHARTRRILMQTIEQKTKVAMALLEKRSFDLFAIVFSESDTAGHHFWAHHDRRSPRRRAIGPEADRLSDTIEQTYCALDRALGRLLETCDPRAGVLVLSDHGFGGSSDRVAYLNRWLCQNGFLRFSALKRLAAGPADVLTSCAARFLPPAVKQALLRSPLQKSILSIEGLSRFGAIDWRASDAFSDELPQNPGIWINDLPARRMPGKPCGSGRRRMTDRIAAGLLSWRDERGRPVVRKVLYPAEVNPGPCAGRAPDLLVELAERDGYRLLAAPSRGRPGETLGRLSADQLIGSKGTGTSGCHRRLGMLAAAGREALKPPLDARLVDIYPSAIAMLDLPVPDGLDGCCLAGLAAPGVGRTHATGPGRLHPDALPTPAQQRLVEKRLEKLGYL